MNRLRPALLAALLATGCIPDVAKLDPFRSAEAFCPVYFDMFAAKFVDCFGVAPYLEPSIYGGFTSSCAEIAAGEKAGRIGFDRAKAEAMVALIQTQGCNSLNLPDSANPFVPLVGPGGQCLSKQECTTASAGCYNPNLTCPGTCATAGAAGALCSTSTYSRYPVCGSAFYCDTSTASPVCAPRVASGQPCPSGNSSSCAAGNYCTPAGALYQCVPQLILGAPCTGYSQCAEPSLYCDPATSLCAPVNAAVPLGGTCDYQFVRCASGLWCDTSLPVYKCAATLPLGALCSGDSACGSAGLSCVSDSPSSATSHCRYRLAEGAACTVGVNGCQEGLYCNGAAAGGAGTCVRSPTVGHACGTILGERVFCLDGWCDRPGTPQPLQGTCTAPYPAWSACTGRECGAEILDIGGNQCTDVTGAPSGPGMKCVPSCAAAGAGSSGAVR
jgi:hypothetical protein